MLAVLLVGAPWWIWRMVTTQKYREGLAARFGRVPAQLRSGKDQRPAVWLHAVSVGEVLAVSRLVNELDRAMPGYRVLISTTTRTGQQLARQRFGEERVFYCPLDLPWAVRAYFRALQPKMLILAETEFWPNLLTACFRNGVPVAVVNARISDRSWPRYRRLRRFWRPLLVQCSSVMAQSATDAERLRALGCAPDRVAVSGNLKFDVRAAGEAEITQRLRQLAPSQRFLAAGSTLEGEEALLLEAWPALLAADPNLILVLAPRHPERFSAVAELLRASGLQCARRSEWPQEPSTPIALLQAGQVVLLDSIGELASVYSIASLAFVGGSLIPAGGHNPLEPAQFGVPIVMGSHYANFRAIVEDLRAHDAICIAEKEEIAQSLIGLLADEAAAKAIGERARRVFELQSGATARTLAALLTLLASAEDKQ
ncbi:MAG TPA: 3-deoxy-D-manno-octulosonic acid transferase [Terracidiphilus sp.]|nr:3-deoxy-D-manno-octulosonic acid transferase [Terracidiphilus sp.]